MLELNVPSRGLLRLEFLVLGLNGTIALDGELLPGVRERIKKLRPILEPWLLSADTQGTLSALAVSLGVGAKQLDPGDEAAQKLAFIEALGFDRVVACGNGANDGMMLRKAALGIAVMGHDPHPCSMELEYLCKRIQKTVCIYAICPLSQVCISEKLLCDDKQPQILP